MTYLFANLIGLVMYNLALLHDPAMYPVCKKRHACMVRPATPKEEQTKEPQRRVIREPLEKIVVT